MFVYTLYIFTMRFCTQYLNYYKLGHLLTMTKQMFNRLKTYFHRESSIKSCTLHCTVHCTCQQSVLKDDSSRLKCQSAINVLHMSLPLSLVFYRHFTNLLDAHLGNAVISKSFVSLFKIKNIIIVHQPLANLSANYKIVRFKISFFLHL